MLNILHLVSSERWTGVADPVVSLCEHQQSLGHTVLLGCVCGQSFERRAKERGITVYNKLHLNRRLNPIHIISDIRSIRNLIREKNIDILHTHLINDNWLAGISLIGLAKQPLLVRTMHKSVSPYNDPLHRILFRKRTNLIITISEQDKENVKNILNLNDTRITCVYGGVDTEMFKPENDGSEFRKELAVPENAFLVGIIARINKKRGHNTFINSIPLVLKENPNIYFTIIGKGEYKKELRKKIDSFSEEIRNHIIMAGYRNRDLTKSVAGLDISVFLGLGSEGSCRAILEAMASGKPVIAARLGVVPETIADRKSGIIIEPNNHEQLAGAILELASNPQRLKEMGQYSRQIILNKFSNRRRAIDTIDAYQNAIENRIK